MVQKSAWLCKFCNLEVRNKAELIKHINTSHPDDIRTKVYKEWKQQITIL